MISRLTKINFPENAVVYFVGFAPSFGRPVQGRRKSGYDPKLLSRSENALPQLRWVSACFGAKR
jgi:hypothetical protein